MTVYPAHLDHPESKNEEALATMNDHVENAAVSLGHANEAGAATVLNEDPDHPVNWPLYKRNINLFLISFHALMTNFIGAGIIPVYATLAEKFDVEIQDVSYMTSIHVSHADIL
ncbi:Translation elongation/initiation factor/Ribosomal beta-barrel [Penicillium paradoxum]|uniref:Translation elongation/initiation factor/Ribosomal beta-barrel n=1 Tax=Penicillium paradoxum TaxID=176176 RepID=UPI002547C17E|nr:Translation elongation/initiation factor/Ribosomal beta-barrel [Penicillium paradoxum]KAJ5773318.1 Translation elongation/initiation factor/Ribosomal beta-barrel [Penicillium paradoxum]